MIRPHTFSPSEIKVLLHYHAVCEDWVSPSGHSMEVFMPYLWDGRQTVFQRVRDAGFRALLPESTDQNAA